MNQLHYLKLPDPFTQRPGVLMLLSEAKPGGLLHPLKVGLKNFPPQASRLSHENLTFMSVKLKHLKAILDKMSPEQLDQPFAVNRDEMGVSGVVTKIRKAKSDLIYDGSDDPSILRTRSQLREDCGYDNEEIAGMDLAIPKGSIYLEF